MIELDIETGSSVRTPSCDCSSPEVVLPGQFYATVRSRRAGERERLLMLAVLEDAIVCYQRYSRARGPGARHLFEEAQEWLASRDRSVLFSFESICDTLEISPEFVRRRLREWEEHQGTPPAALARRAQCKAAGSDPASCVVASRATSGPSMSGSIGLTRC